MRTVVIETKGKPKATRTITVGYNPKRGFKPKVKRVGFEGNTPRFMARMCG